MGNRIDLGDEHDVQKSLDMTDAQWFIIHSGRTTEDKSILAFGIPEGDPTYWPDTMVGIRRNAGIMEYRNAGEDWAGIGSGSGSGESFDEDADYTVTGDWVFSGELTIPAIGTGGMYPANPEIGNIFVDDTGELSWWDGSGWKQSNSGSGSAPAEGAYVTQEEYIHPFLT